MKRRFRLLWLLKWMCTLAILLTVIAVAASSCWIVVVKNRAGAVGIDRGVFRVKVVAWWDHKDTFLTDWKLVAGDVPAAGWRDTFSDWRTFRLELPAIRHGQLIWFVDLPLWALVVAELCATALLWWLDRRRVRLGSCPACGYDVTGNVSGTCPECGRAIASNSAPAKAPPESDR